MRNYDDSDNRRRRGGGRLLNRFRGSRNSSSTNATLNQSRKNSAVEKPASKSVLDALQTLRVKGDDQATLASSQAPSLALTRSTVSTASTTGSGASSISSFHLRNSNVKANPLLAQKGIRQQLHHMPSASPSLWDSRTLPMTAASRSQRPLTRTPRNSSPRGGELRKRIRTAGNVAGAPSPLYKAVSAGAPRNVVESILHQDPSSCAQKTEGGMTPLHCAIERYDTSVDMLMLILRPNPQAAGIRNLKGLNCVDLLWQRFVEPEDYRADSVKERAAALRCTLEEIVDSPFAMSRQTKAEHALQENEALSVFWNTMSAFIHAACHGTLPSQNPLRQTKILHDCIRLNCEPLMIRFVAALHPDQVRQPTIPEEQQRYPIHLAALQSSQALHSVLTLFPRMASQEDGDGRLPLHLAIDAGIEWDSGLEALVQAAPFALSTPDPITGLLPTMLAATASEDLNTTFRLLSSNPMEVMNHALST